VAELTEEFFNLCGNYRERKKLLLVLDQDRGTNKADLSKKIPYD